MSNQIKNLTFDMACWMLSIKMSVILSSSFLWKNVNLLLSSRRVVWTLIVLLFISSVDEKKQLPEEADQKLSDQQSVQQMWKKLKF